MRCLPVFLFAAILAAADPDINGTWKLDRARSEFGAIPPPDSLVTKVEQKGTSLLVATEQKGGMAPGRAEYKYATDGSESVNPVKSSELRSRVRWEGSTLRFSHRLNFQGKETIAMEDEWTLSGDGSTLTQVRRIKVQNNTAETRAVLTRQ
ncbi:MAG: hypothetical protein FJW39_05665 [Acidobacteria bacterium]|nr:hypothetical protein [Acidobacteriota bacterium]